MDTELAKKFSEFRKILESDKAKTTDVSQAFAVVIASIKEVKTYFEKRINSESSKLSEEDKRILQKIIDLEGLLKKKLGQLSEDKTKELSKAVEKLNKEIENVRADIPPETDFTDVYKAIKEIERKIPQAPDLTEIYDLIGEINDKLPKLEKRISETAPRGIVIGGARGVNLYVDGSKKGMANTVNLIPGTGVTLTYARANGRNDITVSASGGSFSILTATGTVNDSNKDFTFVSKPQIVVVNGASYQENNGWSWNSGTLTATLDFAPGSGGNVYGIG